MKTLFLDTETTGLKAEDGHRIIDVGVVECADRKVAGHFQSYFNPEREIDAGAAAVHGLESEFLAGKPLFAERADELIDFISGARVHIHNAKFDVGFLDMELRRAGRPPMAEIAGEIVDTLVIARRMFPSGGNSVDRLCERFGIDNSRRQRHGALLDATLLAEIHLAMTRGQIGMEGMEGKTARDAAAAAGYGGARVRAAGAAKVRVVRADAEELAAHEEWMSEIAAGGKPG